jgi:hypothetical protein
MLADLILNSRQLPWNTVAINEPQHKCMRRRVFTLWRFAKEKLWMIKLIAGVSYNEPMELSKCLNDIEPELVDMKLKMMAGLAKVCVQNMSFKQGHICQGNKGIKDNI